MLRQIRQTGMEIGEEGLSVLRRPIQKRRLADAVRAARHRGEVNIAIGGGLVQLGGWVSTDIVWWSDHYLDVTKPWPVPHGSVDNIYGDNMIEHLPITQARVALKHMLAALKPGGTLRLATPDVEATARAYLDDDLLAERHLDRHRRKGFEVHHRVDLLRLTYVLHGHHAGYMYDERSLSAEMTRAGFADIKRCRAGESEVPSLRGLDTRNEPTENATELILEGRRPS